MYCIKIVFHNRASELHTDDLATAILIREAMEGYYRHGVNVSIWQGNIEILG